MVAHVDEITKLLSASGLTYRMKIPPRMVGVHPKNRFGYGVQAQSVHKLGSEIVASGFSVAACSHACAIEENPDDRRIELFTRTLTSGTEKLAQVTPGETKVGSLSCSHTNQWLRCVPLRLK